MVVLSATADVETARAGADDAAPARPKLPTAVLERLLADEAPASSVAARDRPARLAPMQAGARAVLRWYLAELAERWLSGLGYRVREETTHGELGGRDVLDGEPDRLEDRDGLRAALGGPGRIDAADLDEVILPD